MKIFAQNLLITSKTFVIRPTKWAICYRQFEHVNTDTMFVESFHNKLKTFYLKQMTNKQLDDLIMSYWKLKLMIIGARKRELLTYDVPKKDIDSDIRYERGINIPDGNMTALSNSKWSVQS